MRLPCIRADSSASERDSCRSSFSSSHPVKSCTRVARALAAVKASPPWQLVTAIVSTVVRAHLHVDTVDGPMGDSCAEGVLLVNQRYGPLAARTHWPDAQRVARL
jgi:hypothetical protein